MITYEIAGKLKEAGFPQKGNSIDYFGVESVSEDGKITGKYYIPTLSELIHACSKEFSSLNHWKYSNTRKWSCGFGNTMITGETPEDAVAMLWLEINKKKK